MSSKRAAKNARRKARAAKRVNPRPTGTATPRDSDDEYLDALLTSRGWTVFDRYGRRTMYDWPQSLDPTDGEVTYLMAEPDADADRYRVRCVDGERRMYDDAERLIADLDHIEARRA